MKHQLVVKETSAESSSVARDNVPGTGQMSDSFYAKSTCLGEVGNGCSVSGVHHVENYHDRLSVDNATEVLTSSATHGEIVRSNHVSYAAPSSSSYEEPIVTGSYRDSVCSEVQEWKGEASHFSVSAACGSKYHDHLCVEASRSHKETAIPHLKCPLDELKQDSLEDGAMDQMDLDSSVNGFRTTEVTCYSVSAACSGDHQDQLCVEAGPSNQETTIPHFKCFLDESKQDSLEHGAMDQTHLNSSVRECQELDLRGLLESGAEQLVIDNKV